MNSSMPGFPVLHHLPDLAQTHVQSVCCHPNISFSVIPFSSCLQSFPTSWSFLMIWAFWVVQLIKNPPAMQKTPFWSHFRKTLCRRDRLPTPVFLGFPGGSDNKEYACNAEDLGSMPGLGRSHGQRNLVGYSSWGHKEFYLYTLMFLLGYYFWLQITWKLS